MAKAKKRPAEAWSYVLKADRALDAGERSMFTLAPMSYAQRAAVHDGLMLREGDETRVYRTAGELALAHIISIENFPSGEPQAWPAKRAAREKYLELLDDNDVLEIGNEIWTRSSVGIDEDAIKNSSPPELTSSSGGISTATQSSIPAPPANEIPA